MEQSISLKLDANGLIPAVVQDSETQAVLMVAWMNQEAYELTRRTGQVHFWSRSRQEIWRKGATSGNTLTLTAMWIDCDSDTLLVQVKPAGPACHTGNISCFYKQIK
jgi:phosphoribosyl-AMP cyclohydrolase